MIYFIYGPDSFRLNARIKQLQQGFKKDKAGLDYLCLISPKFTWADFINALNSQSLLTNNKLVIIEDLLTHGTKDLQEKVVNYLITSPSPKEFVLIFKESQEPDKRLKLFKTLNKFLVEHYELLRAHQARDWFKEKTKELNLNLTNEAANMLLSDFSQNLWRLNNELNKLASFSNHETINETIIKQLVPQTINDNIFKTIDALAKRDIKLANRLIVDQLSLGTSEQQLLAMVAYQFRNIALLKTLAEQGTKNTELIKTSGLHPYVVQKTVSFSTNFSKSQLVKVFRVLNKIDKAIKTGKTPPKAGLDILVAQIAGS